jgi:hypothetical protein
MESNVQPSFIPKKPLTPPSQKSVHHVSLFSLITTVIFVTVLVICGAVFGLKKYQEGQLAQKQNDLKAQLDTFEPSLVADLSRLDNRLTNAQQLLNQHLSISAVFSALGNATLKNVRFSSFALSNGVGQRPTINMNGQAQNFTAVAQQVIEFQKADNLKYIKDVSIVNPNLDAKGDVSFTFSASVDPKFLSYGLVQKNQGINISSSTPIVQTTTTSTSTSTASTTKSTKSKSSTH